ncbi:hypothetical protein CR105_10845 [Massilia eurypsychrophila]|jgi:uncharacterized membrane protein|uniref:DUF1700 domain-containing protein n=1 Tax=Massilia eurypsychrophila TaxID=1485217 RepID=A0A2G8TFZ9_9BURK|nr:DUF1700 domain-containing protein [Massilia eurypsychrophila]PIL44966.1 hypothetical protein CR105_10845 [Massilia eurypsychrophila]
MGKLEYLDALKRAMTGLAPELQAKTLAYYEQHFVDGLAAGLSETEIAAELDDAKKIAMTLRASSHLAAFEQKRNPANLLRMVVSALGLFIFNLFMVVPAAVYASLLAAMYACALGFYIAGIAITASGLAGANELVLNGPLRHLVMDADNATPDSQTKITIGDHGVRVFQEKLPEAADNAASDAREPVIRRAEEVAGNGIVISTDIDSGSRATQTFFGLSMVVGSICLFLLSLVVTKYTLIGIRRYVEMNYSLLKGH